MSKITISVLAAVRDGDLNFASAARRCNVSRQAVEQQFIKFRASQAQQRTKKSTAACKRWLAMCQSFGWKTQLSELEKLWWEWHDENGNVLKSPRRWYARSGQRGKFTRKVIRQYAPPRPTTDQGEGR